MRLLALLLCLLSWPALATPVDITYGAGTFTVSSPIVCSGPDMCSIRGAGRDRTTLIWTGTGTMFQIGYTEMSKPPRIEGLTILTRGNAVDTAIDLDGPTTGGTAFNSPVLSDLEIRGENPLTQVWQKAIKLRNVWYPIIDNVWITGLGSPSVVGSPPFPLTSCIEFSRTQVLEAHDFHCFYAQDAVLQTDAELGEGQLFHDFEIVGVNRGFVLRSMGGTAIRDGHVNAWLRAFDLDGKLQISIHDVLAFKWYQSSLSWECIRALNVVNLSFHHNQCLGNPAATGGNLGVYMVGTSDSNVSNNIFGWYNVSASNYGIVLGTASTRNHVTDNQMMNNCGVGGGAGACGAVVTIGGGVVGNWTNFNKP